MFNLEDFLKNPASKPLLYPSPVLLQKAEAITDLEPWKEIAPIMFEIMSNYSGCGLAAPQVGLSYQMFVLRVTTPIVVINPEIIEVGDRVSIKIEGCLSIPGQTFSVSRPTKVKVGWLDLDGKKNIATFEGWTGRAFQHEYDHLLGHLINR